MMETGTKVLEVLKYVAPIMLALFLAYRRITSELKFRKSMKQKIHDVKLFRMILVSVVSWVVGMLLAGYLFFGDKMSEFLKDKIPFLDTGIVFFLLIFLDDIIMLAMKFILHPKEGEPVKIILPYIENEEEVEEVIKQDPVWGKISHSYGGQSYMIISDKLGNSLFFSRKHIKLNNEGYWTVKFENQHKF